MAISVEGPTEREFASRVLAPHLANFGLGVRAVPLNGSVSLSRACDDVRRLLLNSGYLAVTTLYDLYGFQGHKKGDGPTKLEEDLHAQVGNVSRFIPYIQVYEFEALIFAGPEEAGEVLGDSSLSTSMLRELSGCATPEELNDSYETCPSRRLKKLYKAYDKVNHGYRIAERIGLAKMRQACPRFGAWLTRLEGVAADVGA